MNNYKNFLIILALIVPFSSQARDLYAGVQYANLSYSETGLSSLKPTALIIRVGEDITSTFAVEGRFGISISDDKFPGVNADFEISKMAGLYAVGNYEISSESTLYGVLGYSKVQQEFSPHVRRTYSEYDVTYGIGFDYKLNSRGSVNAEYTSYVDKTDFEVSAISLGYTFKF